MAAGCQRPLILGRPGAWPVSCAARKRWPRGSKASRLDALHTRRTVGFQEEADQVSRPCLRSCSASACKGLAPKQLVPARPRGTEEQIPPGRERSGQCVGTCTEFPRLTQVSPLLLSMLYDHLAPVVLSNLLTRFSNSSSARAEQVGCVSGSCAGGPFVFLVRSQRILPLPWPACSGILPHSMSSKVPISSNLS